MRGRTPRSPERIDTRHTLSEGGMMAITHDIHAVGVHISG
jgi:hypothetical protein